MSETQRQRYTHERIDDSEIQQRRVVIENSHGEKLVGILQDTGSTKIVVICHGFQSSKDRIPMVTLSKALERQMITSFWFDFAGNGESEGSFQYGNYRRETEDLHAVVQHFRRENREISAIIGHSKGGNVVLLYAAKYNDVKTVVNISGRFFLERGIEGRLGKNYFQRMKEKGFIDVRNRKGKFEYRVTEKSLVDRLTTVTRVACLSIHKNCRVLTVHGSADRTVPATEAFEFGRYIKNHQLYIVKESDHEFTSHQHELANIVWSFIESDHRRLSEKDGDHDIGVRNRYSIKWTDPITSRM